MQDNFINIKRFSSSIYKIVIVASCLVLIGWQFNIGFLKSFLPGVIAMMNPTSALLFILCATSLYLVQEGNSIKKIKSGNFIGLAVLLVAIIRLLGTDYNMDIGIDQLLYSDRLEGNRMAIGTAINFVLTGFALFIINDKKKKSFLPSQLSALVAFLLSFLIIIAYLYGAKFLYHQKRYSPMALHTAITFIIITTGILLTRYQYSFVGVIMHKNLGGTTARKLLPIGITVPVFIGLLKVQEQKLNLLDQELGAALGISIIISISAYLIWWIAKSLNENDDERKNAALELTRAKDDLGANEITYRNLIENSGVVMYTTSISGCITFCSSKALQLTGYTVKELTGMHFTKLVDADYMEEVIAKYKSQVTNGIDETMIQFCIRTKYGDLKWVEQSAILITEDKIPQGFQCIVKDISERKEMEEVLRKYEMELVQNQERLQSILDNTISFIYIKDLDGNYLITNKQFKETFNVTDEEVIGKKAFSFTDFDRAQRFTDGDNEVLRTSKHVELEEIIEMADGVHHFLIIKFPLLDTQNKIYGLGGIGTDITERVRYEAQLIQARKIAEDAKKLQEQFLANMSHEIRTPMNGIQGMTDLLLETRLTDEQCDFAKTIKRSSDNLLVIINDILDFSKIQAGKLTIEKIDFKLSEVVENTKAIFKQRIKEKGLQFQFNIDDKIPETLNGDPYRLNQVLVNLLGNAIKFTKTGGITINTSIEARTSQEIILEFTIADTGIGIENDKINEMFESFTQASTDTSRKYGGTGLGLAISKQLLEMQRGTISVESEVDHGTTFKFSIPYSYTQTNNATVFVPEDVTNYKTLLKDKKFLIAEDNPVNQKVITHVLKKAGGIVTMANNGLEAVAFLEKDKGYDLIIMDLQMPEMDGYTATRHIRNEMKLTIPIIAMTASALKGEKAKCLAIGMDDYLSKPFDINFIYKRISYFLGQESTKVTTMKNEMNTENDQFNLSLLQEMDDNEYVSEILQIFLSNTPGELKELQKAADANQFDATYKAAHKLKGSAGLLQADELLRILSKAEEFAKAEIREGLPVLAQQANDEYKKMEVPLKEILKKIQKDIQMAV